MASAVTSKTSAAAHMFSSIALLRTVVLLLTFDQLQFVVSSPFLAPLTSCVVAGATTWSLDPSDCFRSWLVDSSAVTTLVLLCINSLDPGKERARDLPPHKKNPRTHS
jgi:hypothetical protein